MSKLDELIKEYCPDGVDYKTIDSLSNVLRGKRLTKKELVDNGIYPVYHGGLDPLGYYNYCNRTANTVMIINVGASAGTIGWCDSEFWSSDGCFCIDNCNTLDNRFIYHYLKNNERYFVSKVRKAGIPTLDNYIVESFKLPVPPLEVQREIVRVLDKFTLLTAELTAELTARKKQYEYYRNDLLSFETKVDRIPLGDLFDFRNGLSKGKDFFGRGIPFIRYTDVYNNRFLRKGDITALVDCTADEIKKLNVKRGDVLFTRTSETAEDVGWSSVLLDNLNECVFNGFTIKATPKTNKLLPEYCSYCFSTDEFRKYVTKNCAFTTRASLTGETLSKYKLAVPSIEVQKKIAEVLDNFEAICSNLNIGLPAEIEARQKQYEFYRDQLLTFVEKGETILTEQSRAEQSRAEQSRPN